MYIHELYHRGKPILSYEVFPPNKGNGIEHIEPALKELALLAPDFMSVTYGAGGTRETKERSIQIASTLKNRHNIEPLFHLTCATSSKTEIKEVTDRLKQEGISNILALGGDAEAKTDRQDYSYAVDLIRDIRAIGGFSIGAACYPEGHIRCENPAHNFDHLMLKQNAGADFFITQLFFKNSFFYEFVNKARRVGITKPIVAGIMPILGRSQIERMIFMCGVSLPQEIVKMLYRYGQTPEDLKKAGMEYALEQAEELLKNGVDGVHLYTMNQPHIARRGYEALHHLTL